MRQAALTVAILIAALTCGLSPASAGELRVVPEAPWLRKAFDEGQRTSETFRALLKAIDASDLVVYARGMAGRDGGPAAYITFISHVGDRRYLMLNISRRVAGIVLTGLLGHELQHAREIADHHEITDARSFESFYREFGFSPGLQWPARAYESAAAVEAGARVREEAASALAADDR